MVADLGTYPAERLDAGTARCDCSSHGDIWRSRSWTWELRKAAQRPKRARMYSAPEKVGCLGNNFRHRGVTRTILENFVKIPSNRVSTKLRLYI